MEIISARSMPDATCVILTLDDGEEAIVHTDLPPDEQFRRLLADWLAAGGKIAPYVAPEPPVPDITRRQLRLWLVRNGVTLASVEAAIDALPEPGRTEAQIEWQDASVYKLSNPLVIEIGAAVGLTDPEMLKQAFRDAALI